MADERPTRKCGAMGCKEPATVKGHCSVHHLEAQEAAIARQLRRREEEAFCRSIGIRRPDDEQDEP